MARREDIETSVWSDPDFLTLPGPARAVYIWSFTNQRCGMAGIYKVSRQAIAMETGFDGQELDDAMASLQDGRFLFYDGRVLFVRTRVRHLRTRSPSIAKAISTDLAAVHGHRFVQLWWSENEHHDFLASLQKPEFADDQGDPGRGGRDPLGGSQGKGTGTGTGKGQDIGEVGGSGGETSPKPSRRVDQTVPPERFPEGLQARLDEVLPILAGIWDLRGGVQPLPRGVGLALMRNPGADHVGVARRLAHWLTAGRGQTAPCKDIAARFGDWVADEIAGAPVRPATGAEHRAAAVSDLDRRRLESAKRLMGAA